MITASDLSGILTSDQYTALQTAIDNTVESEGTIRCILRQYGPVWSSSTRPVDMGGILDPQIHHEVRLTSVGNWQLGHDGTWGNIFWPFQVRSLDAISLDDYDLIAMVTDLPPIADTTVSDSKSSLTCTRVQGIVLWKYFPATGQWSDHREWDVCDSTQSTARANVKLSRDGNYVYMTYGKMYGGVSGLAITRSSDGVNWEDPVLFNAAQSTTLPPLTAFAREGDYMYLISDGSCLRSVATDFTDSISIGATQDITPYVLNATLNLGTARAMTIECANPDNILTTSGLLSLGVSMRLSFEAGYRLADEDRTRVYVPILTGDITEWTTSEQLPVKHLTLQVKDSLSLMDVIGSSESIEWQGLMTDGDNFCPVNAQDKTGATGLGKSLPVGGGTATGSQKGLQIECDGREHIHLATFNGRIFNGMISSESSFYQRIEHINMLMQSQLPGGQKGTEVAIGSEYSGIVFRYMDEHNLWYVKTTMTGQVSIVKRVENPDNEHVYEKTYSPKNFREYSALHIETEHVLGTVSIDTRYWHYYLGRLTVEWRYGLVTVWRNYPNTAPEQVGSSFEVPGFGNTPYDTQASPITAGYCGHLFYSPKNGTIELAPNGDASALPLVTDAISGTPYQSREGWVAENMNQSGVTRMDTPVSSDSTTYSPESPYIVKVITDREGPDPGVFFRSGSYARPLNYGGGQPLHIEFTANAYILNGDISMASPINDASLVMKCKVYYTDETTDDKPSQKGSKGTVTAFGSWTGYSWSMDTLANKRIRRFILSFVDQRGLDYRVGPTTFYVADLHAKLTVPKQYWYLNNVDYSDGERVNTSHDAMQALYAVSGTHFMDRKTLVNASTQVGYTSVDVPLPYVLECDIDSAYGSLQLTGRNGSPVNFSWSPGICQISLSSNGFYRAVTKTIEQGRLRIAVTSASSEGKTFTSDLNGVCDWLTVAIYLDDKFIMDGVLPIRGVRSPDMRITDYASVDIAGFKIGATSQVDNFRVDELHRHIPYFSIDPNEMVATSMTRIIGVTRSVSLYRFNQRILVGRPPLNPGSPQWSVPEKLETKLERAYNYVVPTHFRLVGAWTEKETVDAPGMHATWRNYFFKKDDPNLMTTDEMAIESAYLLKDLRYTRNRISVVTKFNPLVEVGDVVAANGSVYLLDQGQWQFQKAGEAMKITGSLVLKKV